MLNRRDSLKLSGAAALALLAGEGSAASTDEAAGRKIKVAGYGYDRIQAIKDGTVGIDQAEVSFQNENIYSLNRQAFGTEATYEITELGLIPYIAKYINEGFRDYVLIPVFISRTFRHRNIYVHVDSGIEKPEDLRGKRVGTPGYGMSASTWIRGFLLDEYGVKADELQWIETVKSSDAGTLNRGFSRYYFPDDFPLVEGPPGVDESELLLSGGCDALITAITPQAYIDGNPKIRRLFPDIRHTEQQYFKKTGLFPIMHAVAVRAEAAREMPWLPAAALKMYTEAKQTAYANLATTTVLRTTLPWAMDEYEDTVKLMGADYWRYGIESNRKELELVMRYTYEQGLVKKQVDFEQLFHPSTLDT
ncbi:MAG: ABC transporter substrate-binding protein [Halioglobus sp.]